MKKPYMTTLFCSVFTCRKSHSQCIPVFLWWVRIEVLKVSQGKAFFIAFASRCSSFCIRKDNARGSGAGRFPSYCHSIDPFQACPDRVLQSGRIFPGGDSPVKGRVLMGHIAGIVLLHDIYVGIC